MIHFTSDIHFDHANVIKYSHRPFSSADEMNETLIANWNAVVKPTDTCYSLGDFAFCRVDKIEKILTRLNGTKILLLGNHCKEIKKYSKRILSNVPSVKSISTYEEVKYQNETICLFHYGCRVWNKSHRGSWLLYGHSHSSLPPHGKSVDVGVDSTWITGKAEYRPFSFDEIKSFMDKQSISYSDGHKERE
jgi:calcineurin-like phosphoesterase family protein